MIEVRQVGKATLHLTLTEPLEVGRDCDGLLLADTMSSRRHAILTPFDDGVLVEDLHSSNGTWVNGTRITEPTMVGPGDDLLVGATVVVVQPLTAPAQATHPASPTPPMPPPDLARPSAGDDGGSIAAVLGALDKDDLVPSVQPSQDVTITILFSDIEGSTDLANRFGDRVWLGLLKEHNKLVRACIRKHRGTEVKTIGDGFMLTFSSSLAGLDCAIAMQEAMARRSDETYGEWPIRIRIGLHAGEVLHSGGDVYGAHVNLAARVASHAQGGQILVSGLLYELARPVTAVRFSPPDEVELKGFEGMHRVHEVHWQG
jgi:class 3 adenylate cyclase